MKEVTHYLFSIGFLLYLLSLFHALNVGSAIVTVWLSVSVNWAVDMFGHFRWSDLPVRSPLTHSIFTAPLWGGVIGVISFEFVRHIVQPMADWGGSPFWIVIGATVALTHLFLDSLTQAGVYSVTGRIALAHFSYNNLLLNIAFSLVGVGLAAVSLLGLRTL